RGGGQHAQRAGQNGRDVREHVAEEIVGDHDVELLGGAHQLHGGVVGQDMVQRHVGIVLGDALDHLVPEDAGLHDVLLVGLVHQPAAGACQVEGDAGDAIDFVGFVDLGVDRAFLPVGQIGDLLGGAEIDAAGQFAHDEDIEAFHQ